MYVQEGYAKFSILTLSARLEQKIGVWILFVEVVFIEY